MEILDFASDCKYYSSLQRNSPYKMDKISWTYSVSWPLISIKNNLFTKKTDVREIILICENNKFG